MPQEKKQTNEINYKVGGLDKIEEDSELLKYIGEIPYYIASDNIEKDECMGYLGNSTHFRIKGVLELFNYMVELAKTELINYFTLEEAWLLYYTFFNILYDPTGFDPKSFILYSLEDLLKYEYISDKRYFEVEATLKQKIESLSQFQCYIVVQSYYMADEKYFEDKDEITDDDIKHAFFIGDKENVKIK